MFRISDRQVFDTIIPTILKIEGGLVDDVRDSGKITKAGVSLKFLEMNGIDIDGNGVVDLNDIIALNNDKIKDIYYEYFWKRGKVGEIYKATSKSNTTIATQVFDMIVNLGIVGGSKLLQEAMNKELKKINLPPIVVDGLVGSITLNMLKKIKNYRSLNNNMVDSRILKYARIVRALPVKACFLVGWINRAIKFRIFGR